MAFVGLPGITDLGSVPIVYNTDTHKLQQDPNWVLRYAPNMAANQYNSGDVFRNSAGGTVTYEQALASAGASVLSGTNSQPSATPQTGGGSLGGKAGSLAGSSLEASVNQIAGFLMTPTGLVIIAAAVAFKALTGKRR